MPADQRIVIVGGCGHVGLPLGIVFARCPGLDVTLLDIDSSKVEQVNRGEMPFLEAGAEALLKTVIGKSLAATTNDSCLHSADIAITVVGTPVDRHLNPTVHALHESVDLLLEKMPAGSLLILRSTVYPGVTRLIQDRVNRRGKKIGVAFCPERIAEGKAMEELVKLPQIVAAFDPEAQTRARELFLRIAPTVMELAPLEAELAKLFTNAWRYLNFAISNQFYFLAERYGLNFERIHDAITRDYPRMRSFARAGFAAGPCLLKDTLQLSAFSGNAFFMGHAAMLINESLPNFIVDQLRPFGLSDKCVAILGMAFKAESDDIRDSLSYKLKKLLQIAAKEVLCSDPYVKDPALVSAEEAVRRSDIVILGAPHAEYRKLRIPESKRVVDVWGFWKNQSQNSSVPEQVSVGA